MRRWSCADLGDLQLLLERPEEGSIHMEWQEDEVEDVDEQILSPTNGESSVNQPMGLNGQNIDLDVDLAPFVAIFGTLAALFLIGFASYN